MSKSKVRFRNAHVGRRDLIDLAIFLLLLYILLPQLGKFRSSLKLLKHLNVGWLDVSIILALLTTVVATAVYLLLAKKPLQFLRTFAVQLASMFTNRLLPAGLGSLGINFEYLRRNRHSQTQASAVVASSSLVGLVGHLILLGAVLLATGTSLSQVLHVNIGKPLYWLIALIVLVVFSVSLMWFRKIRDNVFRVALGTLKNIRGYRTHPLKLLGAVAFSMLLTFLYASSLLACVEALGAHLAFAQVLIVLTAGVIGGTVTPTPGGLVGAEAGLFAGLVAYKINSAEALAIVLIYRLITYWLAMLIGALALIWVEALDYV